MLSKYLLYMGHRHELKRTVTASALLNQIECRYKDANFTALPSAAYCGQITHSTAMSFTRTSTGVSFSGTVLNATCKNREGLLCGTSIDLDTVLGNKNGKFDWNSSNFSKSAQDIYFDGTLLHASLQNDAGLWQRDCISLDHYIANIDGELQFQQSSQ